MSGIARAALLTINNPTETFHDYLQRLDYVRYGVAQLERGTQGTEHLQCYVEFSRPTRLSSIGTRLRAHVEPRRGTREQARDYCRKDDTRVDGPWEHGTWIKGPGTRTDLDAIRDDLKTKTVLEIGREYPFGNWCRYRNAFQQWRLANTVRRHRTFCWVYLGPSGCGKTYTANVRYPDAYWLDSEGAKWFDGYDGHETVIVDDFVPGDEKTPPRVSYQLFLRLTDRTPLCVAVKGGFVSFLAKRLIITSNWHPREWWPGVTNWPSIERRIKIVREFLSPPEEEPWPDEPIPDTIAESNGGET